ncbi:hypothetical protein BKA64DRAFT_150972 [Cadophora sp. MPI-SDFR-AT-0126]|nr:hypothetical protein BKA64DRAFT_150972 [Leotiomycetes sp. MPI-SDFR-AT-0126]
MPRSSTREIRLPARYRDDEIPNFASTTSTEKKLPQKQINKMKKEPSSSESGGEIPEFPGTVQREATASPTSTATLSSSPSPITPSLDWRSVERYAEPGVDRPITLNGRDYPWNPWSLLTPGLIYAVLHILSKYFILSDTIKLLHLKEHEIEELEKILQPEERNTWVEIHEDELVNAKRILLANIEDEKLVVESCRRLVAYAGVTTCLEEIESGKFDLLGEERDANKRSDMDVGEEESLVDP